MGLEEDGRRMKKQGILNVSLMEEVTALRHGDAIGILDAGMPVPKDVKLIDLALVNGIPSFTDTLKAVLNELIVERYGVFQPMMEYNPDMFGQIGRMMPVQEASLFTADEFKKELREAKVLVRTAEFGSCCNIILYSASGRDSYVEKYNVWFD